MTTILPTCLRVPASDTGTTLVVGLGNPLLTDDGVGLRVIQYLRLRLAVGTKVGLEEDHCGGLRLMERMIGYSRVIIVDATRSGATPGTVREMTLFDVPTRHSGSSHDADLLTALAMGRHAGALLPENEDIRIVGVEAAEVLTFGLECTPAVRSAIDQAAKIVLKLLAAWG